MAEKTMMEILRTECPGAADALGVFFAALVAQPALDEKTKQLVYVAAAAAAGHVRGVPAHVARLRALGATRREVLEALLMTGAPCSNSRAADRQRSGPWAVPKWSAILAVAVDLREQVMDVPPSGQRPPLPNRSRSAPSFWVACFTGGRHCG